MLFDLDVTSLLKFYLTESYPCSYLPGREARSQVVVSSHGIDSKVYGLLVSRGFRRSGVFTYRPWCHGCQACQSLRVDVNAFTQQRSQRRAWLRHQNLMATEKPLDFSDEHYQLYCAYQNQRHPSGGMDQDGCEQYVQFLLQTQVDTRLVEFRDEAGTLRIVSIMDVLGDGISAVYTWYDVTALKSSYGIYAILWQIQWCRRLGLSYLYLGYWVAGSDKMRYKNMFRPCQLLINGRWTEGSGN